MSYFRTDNTQGYSAEQLAELNHRFTREVEAQGADLDDEDQKSLLDHIGERVLAGFDGEGYAVIRRSSTSRSAVTNEGEILGTGGERLDLHTALVEADARNLLVGEGADRWAVEPKPSAEAVADAGIEPDEVCDFLVGSLKIDPAEAASLVG